MRNNLIIIVIALLITGCDYKASSSDTTALTKGSKDKILFIVSNQHTYGNTEINAANHFAEIVLAYDVLVKKNYAIDFVSPEGGAIPIGYLNTSDSIQKKYLYDFSFMEKLKTTLKPEDVDAKKYLAVYYGGGGAAMFGVPENKTIQNIATTVYNNNGIISAICHGTAGLINLKNKNGTYIYEGKQVNGFPDIFENKGAQYYKTFPFSIEEAIKERGGNFTYSKEGWDGFYQVDGRLITGQDPSAASKVAEKIIEKLQQL